MIIGQPVTVRPIGGAIVKKPNGAILAAGGETVTASTYWRRRVADGSVEEVGAETVRPGPIGQKPIVIYADLAHRPPASEFGDGKCTISPASKAYSIDCTSNSLEWSSYGESSLFANMPSPGAIGKAVWTVAGTDAYLTDGIKPWVKISITPPRSYCIDALINAVNHDCSGTLNLVGDSTGDQEAEWFYRLANENLKTALPNVCIRYCVWNDGAQRFIGWITLSNGGSGQRYARFDATNGSEYRSFKYADLPARNSADYEVQIKFFMDNWTPAAKARIVGQMLSSSQRAWYIAVNTDGSLEFNWSVDGTNFITAKTASPLSVANGQTLSVRVKLDVDNGAGGYTVNIDTSPDEATWTSVYALATSAGTTSVYASTADMQIGSVAGLGQWAGGVYDIVVRDGIDGPYRLPVAVEAWGTDGITNDDLVSWGGSPTLYVMNGSHGGSGIAYFNDTTRLPKLLPFSPVQLVILSTGHNDGTSYKSLGRLNTAWSTWLTNMQSRLPTAGFIALTQNPRNYYENSGVTAGDDIKQVHHALPLLLRRFGVEIIDTYYGFKGVDLSTVLSDGVHPNAAGVQLWLDRVWRSFRTSVFDG